MANLTRLITLVITEVFLRTVIITVKLLGVNHKRKVSRLGRFGSEYMALIGNAQSGR